MKFLVRRRLLVRFRLPLSSIERRMSLMGSRLVGGKLAILRLENLACLAIHLILKIDLNSSGSHVGIVCRRSGSLDASVAGGKSPQVSLAASG